MSLKMRALSLDQVRKLVEEYEIQPAFTGQNPFIGSGPQFEILVSLFPDGSYEAELLDRQAKEDSMLKTIKKLDEYIAASKS